MAVAAQGRAPEPKGRLLLGGTTWVERRMAERGLAVTAHSLPERFHRDPGDRIVVAFARVTSSPVVASDLKIIEYARAGHATVVAC
jgi:PIN domain nuclease of toxin-antitoxin system